ncbi:MAG: protein kinase, partial [Pirellulales bacterium]|nr:protein kinase [Pirellulales bacterium]
MGIWRLGNPLHQSDTVALHLAQPADANGSPRWDYVIKRVLSGEDAESRQQIMRFASAATEAVHPNLIVVLDASASSTSPYLVMPRLEGMSMAWHLEQPKSKALPIALWLVRQVAQALSALHAAGWIHGDVKPANVMVGPQGHVTLVDLGFAARIHTVPTGRFRGTPEYCAPESLIENRA